VKIINWRIRGREGWGSQCSFSSTWPSLSPSWRPQPLPPPSRTSWSTRPPGQGRELIVVDWYRMAQRLAMRLLRSKFAHTLKQPSATLLARQPHFIIAISSYTVYLILYVPYVLEITNKYRYSLKDEKEVPVVAPSQYQWHSLQYVTPIPYSVNHDI